MGNVESSTSPKKRDWRDKLRRVLIPNQGERMSKRHDKILEMRQEIQLLKLKKQKENLKPRTSGSGQVFSFGNPEAPNKPLTLGKPFGDFGKIKGHLRKR